jgi:hypothetical protein
MYNKINVASVVRRDGILRYLVSAPLIAELHGRMGHFPKVLRFKRSSEDTSRYDFEEVVQLQRIRDQARARHQE